jgi:hypothetical protein
VIGPTSNDKLSSQQVERSNADSRKLDRGQSDSATASPQQSKTASADDTVNVSRTGQILSQTASATAAKAPLESSDQASELASRIRQQMEQSEAPTLSLYSGMDHSKIGALLAASPL